MFEEAPCFIEVPFGGAGCNAQQLPDLFMFKSFQYKKIKNKGCITGQFLQEAHDVIGRKPVVNIRIYGVVVVRYYFQRLVIEPCLLSAVIYTGIDDNAPYPAHPVASSFILVHGIEYF